MKISLRNWSGLLLGWAVSSQLLLKTATGAEIQNLPQLPKVFLDTTYSPPKGETINVHAPDNLQAALDRAKPGDTIVLEAGAIYNGSFTLRDKPDGAGWIYIVSSQLAALPPPGKRVSPADASHMPVLVGGNNTPAILTDSKAHQYRFCGIEFRPRTGKAVWCLIQIGGREKTLAELPHEITFDRCYIHGDPTAGSTRGVGRNGASIAVIDSYISDCKTVGFDAQAIGGVNGSGPFKIVNNYLEGSGENVMFGGADPNIPNLVPADIEIRHNYVFKPLAWMSRGASHATVKNLLEFKNAQRVLVEGNIFENNWGDAQNGFSFLITPRNQNHTAPWSATRDIAFRLNLMKNIGSGVNISGTDDDAPSQRTERILIENNIFDVKGKAMNAGSNLLQIDGPVDVTFSHNTGLSSGAIFLGGNAATHFTERFTFINNLISCNHYGIHDSNGRGEGMKAFKASCKNWIFAANVIAGVSAQGYPPQNHFLPKIQNIGFVDYEKGNYKLTGSYQNAGTDGKDIGADIDAVTKATAGVLTGR